MLPLPPPPPLDHGEGSGGALLTVVPMLGSLGSVVLVATSRSGAGGRQYAAAAVLLVVTLGLVAVQLDRQRRLRLRRVLAARDHYLGQLATARRTLRDAADEQRRELTLRHPDPAALPALAEEGSRVWERSRTDPAHLHVRHGRGTRPAALAPALPERHAAGPVDRVADAAVRRLVAVHGVVRGVPATVDLATTGRLALDRSCARALLCSATAFHAPADVAVAVLCDRPARAHWDWVKWLPHALSPRDRDAAGPRRLVMTDPDLLRPLLPEDPVTHLLLVLDGVDLPADHPVVGDRPGRVTVLDVAPGGHLTGDPDQCPVAVAEAFARRLPRPGVSGEAAHRPVERTPRDRLRVAIGSADDGSPVLLDLKEAAEQGMGPHGLLVGATGSGKSELLRTLVLRLAQAHGPDQLEMVLVDFKGGATFTGLARLPHVSAVITNLADEVSLVDRMEDALAGELVRRQELLRAAGDHASVRDYEQARTAGADCEPLPSLLVVVDEFSELLAAKPELVDLFVTIGRLGRSLGLHLLLASQRLDEGRLRGLESHLSYRIGLRTFSAQESRAVLGVPDAHELPPVPGLGYLSVDPGTLVRFRAAHVSVPAAAERPEAPPGGMLPYPITEVLLRADLDEPVPPALRSQLDVALDALAGSGPPARRIWLPPLDDPATLDDLLPDLTADPRLGLVSPHWRSRGRLVLPLGIVDRPREQRRDTLTLDLSGATGHVAVVGGPRSGRSALLRTVVAALALTATPAEVELFVLDLGGGGLADLAGLPHVRGVATRADPARVRRAIAEVAAILDRRETSGRDEAERPDVFLVVDGWQTLHEELDDLEPALHRIAGRGLSHGVHLVAAAARWSDLRPRVRDLFGSRLELRLGDPLDSEVDRRTAAQVPIGRPGRGLVPSGHHFLAALPHLDGGLVTRVATAWPGLPAPPLRLLPECVDLDDLGARAGHPPALLLGIDEAASAPVSLDPSTEVHLLVLGEPGSGKTALLRALAREVVRTHTAEEAQLVLVDPRRSLLGQLPAEHVLDHLTSAARAEAGLRELATRLQRRLPGPDVSPDRLRSRSWWHGADVFVLVDDYDLVAPSSGHGSPLAVLQPLLAHAHDVGLHLFLARRTGGAARALFEPVVQTLRDLAGPALLLSGSPDEGPLLGGLRPAPAPPGRARLLTRERGVEVVQLAWSPPT